jgi:hypothetical protein
MDQHRASCYGEGTTLVRSALASSCRSKPMTVARAFVSNRTKEQAGWQIQAAMRCSNCFY